MTSYITTFGEEPSDHGDSDGGLTVLIASNLGKQGVTLQLVFAGENRGLEVGVVTGTSIV